MKTLIMMLFLLTVAFDKPSLALTCNGPAICQVQLTFETVQGATPSANDREFVYQTVGNIVSSRRGILAQGRDPDINAGGEVVYVKEIIGSDGRNRPQLFSTTRGQLTAIEDPNDGGATDPSINSFEEVVYIARDSANRSQVFSTLRGQLTFITDNTMFGSVERPQIDDNGRVVFVANGPGGSENLWEVDSNGTLTQLTFFAPPVKAAQPTLAAETGELVYVIADGRTNILFLFSERDGVIFIADPDPGFNFGVFPDLSPQGLLVFQGRVNANGTPANTDQVWLGIRACDNLNNVCSFPGFSCSPLSVVINIRPHVSPNRINVRRGNSRVAVLSTTDFDATTVDADTVFFGRLGTEASPETVRTVDVNKDGKKDLVFRFSNQDTGLVCGDTQAILRGKTVNGQVIQGADSVVIVGCK